MLAISGTAILQEVLQLDICNDFTSSLGEGDRSVAGEKRRDTGVSTRNRWSCRRYPGSSTVLTAKRVMLHVTNSFA